MLDRMNVIAIPADEYYELTEAYVKLTKLENAGVDNWEGYDEAMREEDDAS